METSSWEDPWIKTQQMIFKMLGFEVVSALVLGSIVGILAVMKNGNIDSFEVVFACIYMLYLAKQHHKIFVMYEATTTLKILRRDQTFIAAIDALLKNNRAAVDKFEFVFWLFFLLPFYDHILD